MILDEVLEGLAAQYVDVAGGSQCGEPQKAKTRILHDEELSTGTDSGVKMRRD